MWYIIAFLSIIIVGVFDGHTSSFAAMLLTFLLGFLSVYSIKSQAGRTNGGKVFGIVFSVYVISAFIASRSFIDGQYFYVSDSMKYLATYSDVISWSWGDIFDHLSHTYLDFTDDNGLFNDSLAFWAYVGNHYFDGTSEFFMTLFLTMFGVLTSLEIFKFFSLYLDYSKAAKYTWIFALLSLYHIYSIVIIRDIVIAYFYMLGLRKIIDKPRILDGFVLLLVVLVTMGIRLYTGLFFGTFIMFWFYKLIQDTKYANYRIIVIPIIVVGVIFVGSALLSSVLMENVTDEVGGYDELYSEREAGGAAASFRSLPVGVRQVVTLLFSQLPLTTFHRFLISTSFSNYYLSILAFVFHIFGFVVFYGLMYYCFIKGLFKKMNFNEKWILIIMLVFVAITLSTHIDLRRCMEAYPVFFLLYIFLGQKYYPHKWHNNNRTFILIGCLIMLAYTFIQ